MRGELVKCDICEDNIMVITEGRLLTDYVHCLCDKCMMSVVRIVNSSNDNKRSPNLLKNIINALIPD